MKLDHITMDTSQGPPRDPPAARDIVVWWGICRSNSLSNSMVNATNTCESRVERGRPVATLQLSRAQAGAQVGFGCGFILERRYFIGIHAHHQV